MCRFQPRAAYLRSSMYIDDYKVFDGYYSGSQGLHVLSAFTFQQTIETYESSVQM
jgi:hypothetical protein